MEITLNHFLFVSGLLFAIGLAGVMVRRSVIVVFMCLELMLSAANLTLVAFSRFNLTTAGEPNYDAQVFSVFIISVVAAEAVVGLVIIVALYRAWQTTDVTRMSSMKY